MCIRSPHQCFNACARLSLRAEAHGGGITQLSFSHDGLLLFTGARRDGSIRCWDIRKSCTVLASFARACPTNQKIGFELVGPTSAGLLTASQDGSVLMYATDAPAEPPATLLTFGDATNAATRHPTLPLLAVAVGERHFPLRTCFGGAEVGGDDSESSSVSEAEDCDRRNGLSLWLMPQPKKEVAAL